MMKKYLARKTIRLFAAAAFFAASANSLIALKLEDKHIEGAYFTVRDNPNAKISAFTKETTIASVTSVFESGRNWRIFTFTYHTKGQEEAFSLPKELLGLSFYQLPFGKDLVYDVHTDGEICAVVHDHPSNDAAKQMEEQGFKKMEGVKPFRFLGMNEKDNLSLYTRKVKKGDVLKNIKPWVVYAGLEMPRNLRSGETLYNGIILPRQWPPDYNKGDKYFDPAGDEPMPVPYLENKPKLINISVGRQLFVDDFLISKGSFEREYHYPKKYEHNPVLKPETEIEKGKPTPFKDMKTAPASVPNSGGLWWNEQKGVYELWYNASWHGTIAYAYSKDGLTWERPNLGIYGDNNQLFPSDAFIDSGAAFYDPYEPDPAKKYKQYNIGGRNNSHGMMWYSADGADFNYDKPFSAGISAERTTIFYNPFRKKWIYSLRWHTFNRAHRCYAEGDDFMHGAYWSPEEVVYWMRPDKNDKPIKKWAPKTGLYNFDAIAYESLIIGFLSIWYGPSNEVCYYEGHPKYTAVKFAYSRDGFHFSRPDYREAIKWSDEQWKWDRGYVQSINGGITVHGDEIRIWYVGAKGFGKGAPKDDKFTVPKLLTSTAMHGNYSLGYATLRRDGFVSLNSHADGKPAEILTEPVQFAGSYLFVNADAPEGALYAQIEDMNGKVIEPYSFENCIPAKGDSTRARIKWRGAENIGKLAYLPVRFRFKMENGKFYSFWVSVAENGRSDGYLGAGMPGCPTPVDTVGDGN